VNELYLDDLREKTHRGLVGCTARGLSTGGRIFGYRAVPVESSQKGAKHAGPTRFEQATIEKAAKLPQPRVHPAWVANKLQRLDELLRRDP
jgi:hypothetical protein